MSSNNTYRMVLHYGLFRRTSCHSSPSLEIQTDIHSSISNMAQQSMKRNMKQDDLRHTLTQCIELYLSKKKKIQAHEEIWNLL